VGIQLQLQNNTLLLQSVSTQHKHRTEVRDNYRDMGPLTTHTHTPIDGVWWCLVAKMLKKWFFKQGPK